MGDDRIGSDRVVSIRTQLQTRRSGRSSQTTHCRMWYVERLTDSVSRPAASAGIDRLRARGDSIALSTATDNSPHGVLWYEQVNSGCCPPVVLDSETPLSAALEVLRFDRFSSAKTITAPALTFAVRLLLLCSVWFIAWCILLTDRHSARAVDRACSYKTLTQTDWLAHWIGRMHSNTRSLLWMLRRSVRSDPVHRDRPLPLHHSSTPRFHLRPIKSYHSHR